MPLIDPADKIAELQEKLAQIEEAQAALAQEGAKVEPFVEGSEACRVTFPAAADTFTIIPMGHGYLLPRYDNEQQAQKAIQWFKEYLQAIQWEHKNLIVRLS